MSALEGTCSQAPRAARHLGRRPRNLEREAFGRWVSKHLGLSPDTMYGCASVSAMAIERDLLQIRLSCLMAQGWLVDEWTWHYLSH